MADDGLLVNFAIEGDFLAPRTKVQGGTWRQRRTVEKFHRRNATKSLVEAGKRDLTSHSNGTKDDDITSTLAKRQKIQASSGSKTRYTDSVAQSGAANRPFISSLFTSNPAANAIPKPNAAESEKLVEPTNAPLTNEQSTFISLGLSSTLAAHLTNKLSIKAPTAIQKAALSHLLDSDNDAFLQAETGSGKTLAYLLPIVQRIMTLSKVEAFAHSTLRRTSGLFAVILAPTRELGKQISVVLESLLRCAHWIVPGIVIGGEKKKSEKARLRRGINILVATPGRLADHLNNTEALDTSSVRWLVLDEGDRLMERGFEQDIKKILNSLDFRLKNADESKEMHRLTRKRVTILCSATMGGDVQRLGELSLREAIHVSPDRKDMQIDELGGSQAETKEGAQMHKFSVPAQLKQSYVVVPAKLRLVSLFAYLKQVYTRCSPSAKALVFVSCAHSVDFHFQALCKPVSQSALDQQGADSSGTAITKHHPGGQKPTAAPVIDPQTQAPCPFLSSKHLMVRVYRLHGSLQQSLRTSTLKSFTECPTPALLICTDIASRGLDVSNVDRVIEYDPAFSREEHLHRIGRTARAGNTGHATIFLMPGCEEGYVEVLKAERAETSAAELCGLTAEALLKSAWPAVAESGSQGKSKPRNKKMSSWEQSATDLQLDLERWASENSTVLEAARQAYQSHVRAYTTHVKDERPWFDMQQLHLGHLAKAFALRDRPSNLNVPGLRPTSAKVKSDRRKAGDGSHTKSGLSHGHLEDDGSIVDISQARKKMQSMARAISSGASEFNLG